MKKIYFAVTNDLTYDQRMHRICNTLSKNGYAVTIVGLRRPSSIPLKEQSFKQKRITCWFQKSKWFYREFNIRLFCYLLFKKMDAICAIDLDTILPCLLISKWKNIPRIYDAHEFFTGMKEVITRPHIKKKWDRIEKYAVPKFKQGYTVSDGIADEMRKRYSVEYATIRNLPLLKNLDNVPTNERFIIYQGAVNEGRGFEFIIPAMQMVDCRLIICGNGNFMPQLRNLVRQYNLEEKIELKGMLQPDELWEVSQRATIGISLTEQKGLNQHYALPNRLFDYIMACIPQLTMNLPEYAKINSQFDIAVLIDDISPQEIAKALNKLLNDSVLYSRLKENCKKARLELNWEKEEKKLLSIYQSLF